MNILGKYCLILFSIVAVLGLMVYFLLGKLFPEYGFLTHTFLQLLLIYFCTSLLAGYMLTNAMKKRPQLFVRAVMGTTVLKLFVYLAALVVYLLLNKAAAAPIVIAFFTYYLLFTVAEKVFLLNELKKEQD